MKLSINLDLDLEEFHILEGLEMGNEIARILRIIADRHENLTITSYSSALMNRDTFLVYGEEMKQLGTVRVLD